MASALVWELEEREREREGRGEIEKLPVFSGISRWEIWREKR